MNLTEFKNKYQGERCFIIGNGPSLERTDLKKLNEEYSFATNEIHKIYQNTEWRPSFYVCFRNLPRLESLKTNVKLDIPCFFSKEYRSKLDPKDNIYYINSEYHNDDKYNCLNTPDIPDHAIDYWSDDIVEKIYWYNTSLYPCYQLANYMGFDEIYLLGCDLGQDTTSHIIFEKSSDPYYARESIGSEHSSNLMKLVRFIQQSDDPIKAFLNSVYYKTRLVLGRYSHRLHPGQDPHFGEDYYTRPKVKRGLDDKQRRAHKLAKMKLNERNIDVYNSTIGGKLEVFPRIEFKKLFK